MDEPVSQGDIFLDVPWLVPLLESHLIYENNLYRAEQVVGGLRAGMKVIADVNLTPALVIEQSCDAPTSLGVALAPLVPWKPEGKPEKQWKQISNLGTSLAHPTRFYLPAEPMFGLGRQLAELDRKFFLPATALVQLISQGKRVATLSDPTLGYLQFRLGAMYLRAAREDYDWPSVDDLQLRQRYLQNQITTEEGNIKGFKNKLAQSGNQDESEALQAKISAAEFALKSLRPDLEKCSRILQQHGVTDRTRIEEPPSTHCD